MELLTMLKCGQARAGPEPRALVCELVEAVLGDAVEHREHAPVADGDRLVTHFRVLWNLRARDGCHHCAHTNDDHGSVSVESLK